MTIPVDRLIYSATPCLVRRHVLSPPKNKSQSFVRLSHPCATNIGPPHCARQHALPRGTAVPPALLTLKFPAATLSTWHRQKKIQISFPSLIFVLSHLESRTAVLLSFSRSLPLCLQTLYSPVATPHVALQPPYH